MMAAAKREEVVPRDRATRSNCAFILSVIIVPICAVCALHNFQIGKSTSDR